MHCSVFLQFFFCLIFCCSTCWRKCLCGHFLLKVTFLVCLCFEISILFSLELLQAKYLHSVLHSHLGPLRGAGQWIRIRTQSQFSLTPWLTIIFLAYISPNVKHRSVTCGMELYSMLPSPQSALKEQDTAVLQLKIFRLDYIPKLLKTDGHIQHGTFLD